ncbi:hypothetical protein C8034_v010031 [Colletotrichum sidae]|uniref:Rhodopsin domain-containing protein n=1 Tax=Colletotrichum sidae TaxID=1347389 RepID=A0A4R8THQ2_9PEZI|nr:hypothetical protein C8034_v010031 [Colletotrichum sidae]
MAKEPISWLQNLGIAIEIFCPALALIVTSLRLYIRIDTKNLGWDDACICAALVLSIALGVGSIICSKELYIGIHHWDVPQPVDARKGMLWIFIVGTIYNPILALAKQSVLIFLLRFSGAKSMVRNVIWTTAVFNIALMLATLLVLIFQCTPVEASWNKTIYGNCVDGFAFAITAGSLTVLTDIIIVGLPFYVFLGSQMGKRKKIGLMAIFALGILVTVVSIARLYFLAANFTDTSPDKNFSLGFCVSQIECSLAIITASAPALWPLIRRWMPQLQSSKREDYYNRKYNTGRHGWIRTTDGPRTEGGLGTTYGMESLNGRRAQTEVRSEAGVFPQDSNEELMKGTGITRTTNVVITSEANSGGK